MSQARACLQCRAAKVKCDRIQPACTRCVRRGSACTGSSASSEYVFRDERATARRNSQRARGEHALSALPGASSVRQPASLDGGDGRDVGLQRHYDWLNARALRALPEPLKRDVDSRAVDRFFFDWILFPGNDGFSPGHLHTLPELYHNAERGSLLWHAVHAVAFADVGQARDAVGTSFAIKARRNYGEALACMRSSVASEQELIADSSFASLILIDCFEAMYLAHDEPLGVHSNAVKYLMRKLGDEQLRDRSRFDLWRVANCRLQARQLQSGEEPDSSQVEMLSKLNTARPDIHVTADILQISSLCATAKRLIDSSESIVNEMAEQISDLLSEMRNLIASIEFWTSNISGVWKPKSVDSKTALKLEELDYGYQSSHPLAHYHCTELLSYSGTWFAYIWNFHAASQILLRESLVQIVHLRSRLEPCDVSDEDWSEIPRQQRAVESLSASILQSFPPLVGFTDATGEHFDPPGQGKVVGRFLALFAMTVVRKARFTSEQQRLVAGKVVDWIYANHSLG